MTIDSDTWARCREVSAIFGKDLSWSRIADFAFLTMVEQMEGLRAEVAKSLPAGATPEQLSALFLAYYHRHQHKATVELYDQIEAELRPPLKEQKASKAQKAKKNDP